MRRASLTHLSDHELESKLNQHIRQERSETLIVLLHLAEVDRRRLHLKRGYTSLIDYCVERHKYSVSAAGRRVQAARCVRRYPEAYAMLERRELSLSVLCKIARILTPENAVELLEKVRWKSQKEADEIVALYKPRAVLYDSVKPVCVRVPTGCEASNRTSMPSNSRSGNCAAVGSSLFAGAEKPAGPAGMSGRAPASTEPKEDRIKRLLEIKFFADAGFMKKYTTARALLSNRLRGRVSFETVLEAVLDEFIDRNSPESKKKRREKRAQQAKTKTRSQSQKASAQHGDPPRSENIPARSRQVPAKVRDEVFVRDRGRCTYVTASGKRCTAKQGLHVDYVMPFARGGATESSNLRLLCAQHNMLEAERSYSPDFMTRFRRRE